MFSGESVFERILASVRAERWKTLDIGELIGVIANELEGAPYRAGILELYKDREVCTINMLAFDCVTFVETALGFARMLKKGGSTPAALLDEVRLIRYRDGIVGDYTTRLHYTSDWFLNNEQKKIVRIPSGLPGERTFTPNVYFMSEHPDAYMQLIGHPELVEKIKRQEQELGCKTLRYIPISRIIDAEPYLKTGDLVGICTKVPGLDVAHMGMIIRNERTAQFMHASSRKGKMKVALEPGPIHTALKSNSYSGIIVARPLEVH